MEIVFFVLGLITGAAICLIIMAFTMSANSAKHSVISEYAVGDNVIIIKTGVKTLISSVKIIPGTVEKIRYTLKGYPGLYCYEEIKPS